VTAQRRAQSASRISGLKSLRQFVNDVRPAKAIKRIYWTEPKLQKLFRSLIKPDRQEWFAARVRELQSWPEVDKDQVLEAAARIQPRRLMDGKWVWPKRELEIQLDLLRSAPENRIDLDGLRAAVATMDNRAADRLIAIIAESGFLHDTTVPLECGLPQPQEVGLQALRRIRKADAKLRRDLAGDPDGDLAARRQEVPRANLKSHSGRLEERSLFKVSGKYRCE
jgi:hypothetical protein